MLPFKRKQTQNPESTEHTPQLAMLISAGKIKCAIYELKDHTIHVLGVGEKVFSVEGKEEDLQYKELESAAADAIDSAVQVAEVDVSSCIFGVPQSWLYDNNLKDAYNDYVEKLSRSLDIEGVAFVSVPHAIAYFLQYEHKVQPTTYLIGCTREGATLSYVQKGKVMETHKISWQSAKLGTQIANGLSLFEIHEEKPSTMYLYGVGDLHSAKTELEKHDWQSSSETPSFISKPEVIVLTAMTDIHALVLVGAKDYARQVGLVGKLNLNAPLLTYPADPQINSVPVAPTHTPVNTIQSTSNTQPDESMKIEAALAELSAVSPITPTKSAAPLGFVKNADARTEPIDSHPQDQLNNEQELDVDSEADLSDESEQEIDSEPIDTSQYDEPKPSSKRSFRISPKRFVTALLILLIFFLVLCGGLVFAYYTYPNAEVTVYVKPSKIDKNLEITARKDAQISTVNNTVPLQEIETEITATASIVASGTKLVGESATGTMIIYNKTTNEIQVKKGTSLKINNQEFLTDADVTVASATADISGQTNGKAEIGATAKEIGTAGNVKKGLTLAVGTRARSELEAEVKDDFSGGSEQTVKVVASKDLTTLATTLRESAKSQEANATSNQNSVGEIRFVEAISKGKESITNDKKAGDEANEVRGEIKYTISTFAVKEQDVETLLQQIVDQSIPQGFEKLAVETQKVNSSFVAYKDGTLTFRASPSVQIIPIIDTKSLIADIVGKKQEDARKTLTSRPNIYDASFEYNVSLPTFLVGMPQKAENISIKREIRDTNI